MKPLNPKYRIYNHTKENVNDINFPAKLTSKKWSRLSRFAKSVEDGKIKVRPTKKPRALKRLFKQRLLDRQKFKMFYGLLTDKQLKKQYKNIKTKCTGHFMNNLITALETRVDSLLWRSRLFKSIFEVHQIINHGFIKINNEPLDKKNTKLKPGDYVWVNPDIQKFSNRRILMPNFTEWSNKLNLIVLIKKPDILEIQYPFKFSSILIFDYLNNK
jgi:ribosomal protein S4